MVAQSRIKVSLSFAVALLAALALAMPAASAPPSGELKRLVKQATQAYADGEYQVAVDKLLAAYRIEAKPRLLYNVARSYEEMGDCRAALVYYRSFGRQKGAEASLVKKARAALQQADDSCPAFSKNLSGRVSITSEPTGAEVSVDGKPVGTTPTEIAGLSSGKHAIEVELDGYRPATNTLDLAAGEDREAHAILAKAVPEGPAAGHASGSGRTGVSEDVTAVGQVAAADDAGINVPAVALVGVGVVGVGLGAYFDLVAIPNTDDERSGYAPDTQKYADLTDERATEANGALAGYIGGGALLAAGATWLIIDMTAADEAEQAAGGRVSLEPVAAPREGGFVAGFAGSF